MNEVLTYLASFLKEKSTLVIGCSGGPDSMCLLHVLLSFQKKFQLKLICAHVNHNVRKESQEEAIFVENYCHKHDIIFEHMVITEYNDDNFHNQARNKRYNFFKELISKYQADILMTAHHADDLMETILMRISRGSTLKGYRGFDRQLKESNYLILRPLMTITKKEILEYNGNNNIPYCLDYTNDEDHYTRNRYRHHLLPFLKSEDLNVHQKYLKFHETLKEYDDFINEIVQKTLKDSYNDVIEISKFNQEHPVIQRKIVSEILRHYYPDDLFLVNDTHIDAILDLTKSNKANTSINLPNNVIVRKTYNNLEFIISTTSQTYEIELKDRVSLPDDYQIAIVDSCELMSNYCTRLDSKTLKLPLIVRSRKTGDKMFIKNMTGSKKLKDIFIDEKIPLPKRSNYPIVTDSNGKIVFLPGLKKSQFDREIKEKYDIILRYSKEGEEK